MKDKAFRGWVIFGVLALCLISLWPSYQVHSLSGDAKEKFIKENPNVFGKAINFGLDLAGGTHVVVEIDTAKLDKDQQKDAVERSLEIIRNRVDQFGLSEPQITTSGNNRIVAELAGVPAERARDLIGETAKLEFKLVVKPDEFLAVLNRIDGYLAERTKGIKADTIGAKTASGAPAAKSLLGVNYGDSAKKDTAKVVQDSAKADTTKAVASVDTSVKATTPVAEDKNVKTASAEDLKAFKERPFGGRFIKFGSSLAIAEEDVPAVKRILEDKGVISLIPLQMQFAFGRGFEKTKEGKKLKLFYALKKRAEMSGEEIVDANVQRVQGGMTDGEIAVDMKFGGVGPKKFATITGNNINRQLAIVLDDQVVSAPVIRSKIPNGQAQITGIGDFAEGKQLAVVLKAGALPVPMQIVELRSVGATLGDENIKSGLMAGWIGLALVVAFMFIYYKGPGFYADLAVLLNVLIVFAALSAFHGTLTLPGMAGIILTIGIAVDANVLIYERIREELRAGRSTRMALNLGYEKAFSAIFDSHVTTFLTAFILYKIGVGPIKGFGLTLMIGISSSLFTSLYVTRWLFAIRKSEGLDVGKGIEKLNHPNLQVMAKRKVFMMVSGVLILASFVLMFTKGFEQGIDFKGGRVYTVQLQDQAVNAQKIESAIESAASELGKPVVKSSEKFFMISLPRQEGVQARPGVEKALATLGQYQIVNEEEVGPTIGAKLKADAGWAMFWSILMIVMYIWLRFGRHGLGFGLGALVALVHDVILTLGFISLLGVELDVTVIAAILTIIGYSVNDSIVVFDRIRERTQVMGKESFSDRVNTAINQTLSRTFNTALTVFLTVLALVFFGGHTVYGFSMSMLIGLVVGTYSSVFVASPIVVWWANRRPSKS